MSKSTDRDELFSGGFASTSNSLLRMVGGWGNIGGPGMFMIRTITSGTITSIFVGVTGAMISAMMYDTAGLPFVVFSCAGFILGAYGFYRDAVRKSLLYLDRYPRLLQLHLDANFPSQRFLLWSGDRFRSSQFTSWTLRSMLVVGWLNAMPAIESIIDADEQRIMEAEATPTKPETES